MGRKRRRGASAPAAREPSGTGSLASRRGRRWAWGLAGVVLLGAAALLAWPYVRPSPPPSLLLVTIDTLRADRVGAWGYAPAATPVLDGLARRGVRFADAEATVPLTGPSHASILTGLYPPVHGVRDNVNFPLDARHEPLAARLKARGYRTAAFVGAYPVAAAFGFGTGFDTFDEDFHESAGFGQGAERPGNEVADAAIRWLGAQAAQQPFFAWVHFYDPHAPYHPPPPFRDTFRERPYDGEVAFTDVQVGRVLEALDRSGLSPRTVVAVVADHGEGLGDHGESTHGVLVYRSTLHVPMILAGPGVPEGQLVTSRVGTVDLLPTLLGLLGLPLPEGLPGRDLRPAFLGKTLPREELYAESLFGRLNCRWSTLRVWSSGDWKLIQGAQPELYNIAEDPGERDDRASQEPERARRMADILVTALARMAPRGDSARSVALSAEQEERLRSLGYVGGGGTGGGGSLDEPGLPDPRERVHVYEELQHALGAASLAAISRSLPRALDLAGRDPGNPFARFAVGSLAYRGGQLELAARAFEEGLSLDPDRPGQRLYYGQLLRDMGRLDESERQLRLAVEQTTPDDTRTPLSLALTLVALSRTEEAEPIIQGVLQRSPKLAEAHGALGELLLAQGRARDAVPHLQQALDPRELDSYLRLATAYLSLGDAANARQAVDRALSRNPSHPWALALLGRTLALEGRRGEALAALRRSVSLRPRRAEVWTSLALGFDAAGDPAAAASCRKRGAAEADVSAPAPVPRLSAR